jgi:UDP-glucose 4-epimerase
VKYLVTGGAGFIGSHLTDALLAAGHQVMVLDDLSTGSPENVDPRAELVIGDVASLHELMPLVQQVDGVYHLAAIASVDRSRTDWRYTTYANLFGTVSVLDAISKRAEPIPMVYASSAAVYGDTSAIPIIEGLSVNPKTAYGVDKYSSELHAGVGCTIHGIPSTGLRFFNVYGARQDPASPYSGVISIFARLALEGKPLCIHGDGGQTRDFIYVQDVVHMLQAAMLVHHGEPTPTAPVYNACTGEETSIHRLALLLIELAGSRSSIQHLPQRHGDIYRSVGAPERATLGLGVAAATPIREGLAHTLAWMRNGYSGKNI